MQNRRLNLFNISIYLGLVILLSLYLLNISSWNSLIHNFSWLSWTTKPIISLYYSNFIYFIIYGFYFFTEAAKDFGFIKNYP